MTSDLLYYSFLAGLTTGIGSLFAYLFTTNQQLISFLFGFTSGMMLYLSYFSLLPASITYGDFRSVFFGILFAVLVMGVTHLLPKGKKNKECAHHHLERVGLFFIFAVIAHHIPEGIAIGVGFEAEHHMGMLLMIALAIHHLPEGMALALPLISAGRSPIYIMGWSLICGLTLPAGTWIGMHWLNQSTKVMSFSLAFAAATMVWIIVDEVFPQAFRLHRSLSLIGLAIGGLVIYLAH